MVRRRRGAAQRRAVGLSCRRGAHYCATPFPDAPTKSYLDLYLFDLTPEEGGMPPLPSRPLSERDKEIVRRWEANPIP